MDWWISNHIHIQMGYSNSCHTFNRGSVKNAKIIFNGIDIRNEYKKSKLVVPSVDLAKHSALQLYHLYDRGTNLTNLNLWCCLSWYVFTWWDSIFMLGTPINNSCFQNIGDGHCMFIRNGKGWICYILASLSIKRWYILENITEENSLRRGHHPAIMIV